MPRELLLLRHAKSDWESGFLNDFDRPLAKRGRQDAPAVGEWLSQAGLIPDLVVSSPAARARETALLVCKAMQVKEKKIVWDGDIYESGVNSLLAVLGRCPVKSRAVLLIGHNPGLEELLRFLLGEDVETPADGKLLPTATVARLEMPKDWESLTAGCAKLLELRRPRREKG
ncbi:MAG TPA: histidine phosphatase family protein [Chromatiaceae bacterium]|nr:histidine phosphatase family protein [Chromatiaceae bacterium]